VLTVLIAVMVTILTAIAAHMWGAIATSILVGLSTLAAISINATVIPVLIAILSSGFIFGLFKIMPERRSILVQASENAVKVVNEAIGTLQKELTEARLEIARLEGELSTAKQQREKFENEIIELRRKITRLETQLEIYQRIQGARVRNYPLHDTERRRDTPDVPDPPFED
jgi:peptidoglycan hydrolase CwlO-like protein